MKKTQEEEIPTPDVSHRKDFSFFFLFIYLTRKQQYLGQKSAKVLDVLGFVFFKKSKFVCRVRGRPVHI